MHLKIGFSLPHMGSVASAENIAKAARFAESENFDSIWVIDRILWPAEPQLTEVGLRYTKLLLILSQL